MPRRTFIAAATALAAVAASPAPAHAQGWPARPITLIVPFAPGGATDIVGRITADQIGKTLGQTVIVENKGGAAGAVGMGDLARAQPDGYTFALITDSIPIQPLLNRGLNWNMEQFTAIAKIATSPEVLVVHPKVPANNVKELVELAKSRPGSLSFAASSTGSVHHLAGEVFKQQTGIDIVHIPYKGGGQSIVDMVAGRIDVGFIGLAPILGNLKNGQLRALALTGDSRNDQAPDVPTFREAGYGEFDVELWIGLVGLEGTPPEAVDGMRAAIEKMLATESVQANFRDIGFEPVTGGQTGFGSWLAEQQRGWDQVIDQLGMKQN